MEDLMAPTLPVSSRTDVVSAEPRANGIASHLLDTQTSGAMVRPMPLTPEELASEALGLPADDRARLADLIVESLDTDELGQNDNAWLAEARLRRDDVRAGRVKTIPSTDALKQVRDALKR
jgi:hypothetical protein